MTVHSPLVLHIIIINIIIISFFFPVRCVLEQVEADCDTTLLAAQFTAAASARPKQVGRGPHLKTLHLLVFRAVVARPTRGTSPQTIFFLFLFNPLKKRVISRFLSFRCA